MQVHYDVSMPDPATHLFHVRLTCDPVPVGEWCWQLPAWTPGSYLMREFARQVDDVAAFDGTGAALPVRKTDKLTWRVRVAAAGPLALSYTVYAHELTVRTSYLDTEHGMLNGTSVLMYAVGHQGEPGTLQLALPEGWEAFTGLAPAPSGAPGAFSFRDYDELVDCPIEMGTPAVERFWAGGIPHELVVTGGGPLRLADLAADLACLVPAAAAVFDGLPYSRYVFLLTQTDQGGGGLEHKNSAVMMLPRFTPSVEPAERHQRVLHLFAHEFFHAWNVKRLHPEGLGPFDYTREVYTDNLWLAEGGTDYYAGLLLARAGLTTAPALLKHLAEKLHQDRERPGRLHQSLAEASRDAWIKFYRPDAHSPNATVSYYARGALVCWLLDLTLREATGGRASLDALLRELFRRHPEGYPDEAPAALAAEMGGPQLAGFFAAQVYRPGDLSLSALASIGLHYEDEPPASGAPPYTGLTTAVQDGRLMVTQVQANSPAEHAGLAPADELVAWNRFRLAPGPLAPQVGDWPAGVAATIQLARRGVMRDTELTPQAPRPTAGRLVPDPDAPEAVRRRFQEWCGQPWPFAASPPNP